MKYERSGEKMPAVMHHLCIQTNTYAASLRFYQKLGFKVHSETQNFHGRAYNTWLSLGDFYLELQTGKGETPLETFHKEQCGPVHFCLLVPNLRDFLTEKNLLNEPFNCKNNQKIYQVAGSDLAKLSAPEGTIVELRQDFKV
jgi:glyoxylase I family protein